MKLLVLEQDQERQTKIDKEKDRYTERESLYAPTDLNTIYLVRSKQTSEYKQRSLNAST